MLWLCLVLTSSIFAQTQKNFSIEGKVQKPIDLPSEVMQLLIADKDVREVLDGERTATNKVPSDWYSATEVQLAPNATPSIIVIGHSPIGGAHAAWFWIFQSTQNHWRVVLHAVGDELSVLNRSTAGAFDMEASYFTASTIYEWIYRYDGQRYRLSKTEKEQTHH